MVISKSIRAAGPLSAVLLLLFVAHAAAQGGGAARIEGVVLQEGTGTPLAGAQVTLTLIPELPEVSPGEPARRVLIISRDSTVSIAPATTDEQGHFVSDGLAAGTYWVRAQANGFVEAPGPSVKVAAGQSAEVAIRLQLAGNISGQIRDRDQRPLAGVAVHLLQVTYDSDGSRTLEPVAAVRTNDRGDYRFFWMTPGRYYLRAAAFDDHASPGFDAFGLSDDSSVSPAGFPHLNEVPAAVGDAYFPGSPDFSGARSIEVPVGGDLTGVDWVLQPKPQTYRVRARIVYARTGKPVEGAEIHLSPANADIESPFFGQQPAEPQFYDPSTGIVEFRRLKPGAYTITAAAYAEDLSQLPEELNVLLKESAAGGRVPDEITNWMSAQPLSVGVVSVTVSDSDVDDVVVNIGPAGTIHVQIRIEGELPKERSEEACLQLTRVGFQPFAIYARCSAASSQILQNIAPGIYRIFALTFPEDLAYLKEARLDGMDVLNAPANWAGGNGSLDVVISTNGGRVRGTVVDDRGDPAQGAEVVLVPDRARSRSDLYRVVSSDEKGQFVLSGIAPGAYKVFSWETIKPNEWFDPEVIERSESRGIPVTVAESSVETIDVRIISSEGSR